MAYLNPKTVPVPAQDAVGNAYFQDVIGNKTDTSAADSLVGKVKALPDDVWEGAIGTTFSPLTREGALRWAGGIGLRKTDIAITTDGAATVNCF